MSAYIASAMQLRFVVREVEYRIDPVEPYTSTRKERILQYGLRPTSGGQVEWFDVPCVEEPKP